MSDLQPLDVPMNVTTVEGEIVLTHPSGPAAVALTPNAALETGQRLSDAARAVLDQSSQAGAGEE